jgi:hypothetical protein
MRMISARSAVLTAALSALLVAAGTAVPPALAAPQPGAGALSSPSWAGYVAEGRDVTFRSVQATFFVPYVGCESTPGAAVSFWVGMDGVTDHPAEAAGVQVTCHGINPRYRAWFDNYPRPGQTGMTVFPGDSVTASVTYSTSSRKFTLLVTDNSTRHHSTAVLRCAAANCARTTAEVLAGALGAKASSAPLADYEGVSFTHAAVQSSAGQGAGLSARAWHAFRYAERRGTTVIGQPTQLQAGATFDTYGLGEGVRESLAAGEGTAGQRTERTDGSPSTSFFYGGYQDSRSGVTFSQVGASFFVPYLNCQIRSGGSLEGFEFIGLHTSLDPTSDMQQAGLFSYCNGSQPVSVAMIEVNKLLLASGPEFAAGDLVTARVVLRSGTFHMTVRDVTSGKHFDMTDACSPSCGRAIAFFGSGNMVGGVTPLPQTDYQMFSLGGITVTDGSGQQGGLTSKYWDTGEVLEAGHTSGEVIGQPTLVHGGNSFDVYWEGLS